MTDANDHLADAQMKALKGERDQLAAALQRVFDIAGARRHQSPEWTHWDMLGEIRDIAGTALGL